MTPSQIAANVIRSTHTICAQSILAANGLLELIANGNADIKPEDLQAALGDNLDDVRATLEALVKAARE